MCTHIRQVVIPCDSDKFHPHISRHISSRVLLDDDFSFSRFFHEQVLTDRDFEGVPRGSDGHSNDCSYINIFRRCSRVRKKTRDRGQGDEDVSDILGG